MGQRVHMFVAEPAHVLELAIIVHSRESRNVISSMTVREEMSRGDFRSPASLLQPGFPGVLLAQCYSPESLADDRHA